MAYIFLHLLGGGGERERAAPVRVVELPHHRPERAVCPGEPWPDQQERRARRAVPLRSDPEER